MTERFVLFMLAATMASVYARYKRWGLTVWWALFAQCALVMMLIERLGAGP